MLGRAPRAEASLLPRACRGCGEGGSGGCGEGGSGGCGCDSAWSNAQRSSNARCCMEHFIFSSAAIFASRERSNLPSSLRSAACCAAREDSGGGGDDGDDGDAAAAAAAAARRRRRAALPGDACTRSTLFRAGGAGECGGFVSSSGASAPRGAEISAVATMMWRSNSTLVATVARTLASSITARMRSAISLVSTTATLSFALPAALGALPCLTPTKRPAEPKRIRCAFENPNLAGAVNAILFFIIYFYFGTGCGTTRSSIPSRS